MKKLYSIILLLMVTASLTMAQMAPWFYGSIPDDWKTNPAPKKTYQIWSAPETFDFVTHDVDYVWDSLPTVDTCKFFIGATADNRAPESPEDFTAKFKLMYDADNLYVLLKVTDDFIEQDSIVEEWEVQWATYPDSLPMDKFPGKDTVVNARADFFNPKQALAYWDAKGSFKSSINIKGGMSYVGYGIAYTYTINWSASGAALGLDYKFTKVSSTEYTLMYIIPFSTAMANFVPSPDTLISLEIKVIDRDPLKKKIQASGNTTNNDVYQTIFYAGKAKFNGISTGISTRNSSSTKFIVYPNPVSGTLQISNSNELRQLTISNLVGQTVKQFSEVPASLDMSDLAKGMYIVRMTDMNNQVSTEKILVK